jgi:hypothetical protein
MHRSQFVLSIAPTSRKKARVALPDSALLALASSRASRNWRDSGRQARKMAAASEKPAPIK